MPTSGRLWWAFLAVTVAALLSALPHATKAGVERRLALVVTNQAYERELIPLQFTHADGEIVSGALQRTGFEVQVLRDGSKKAFLAALADFERKLAAAGPNAVAFFYFSGHCWADTSSNYIILDERLQRPIGELPRNQQHAALPAIGVPLKAVADMIGRLRSKASFVVIDSHLDVAEPTLVQEVLSKKDGGEPHRGLILAAQGRPGMPAADSNDFSKALAGGILTPGLSATEVFKQVQVKVAEVTNGKQVPWFEDQLLTPFQFREHSPPVTRSERADTPPLPGIQTAALPADLEVRVEVAMWEGIVNSTDARLYQAYLASYPQGRFTEVAKRKLTDLEEKVRRASVPGTVDAASPGKRVALVIGNAAYQHESKLKNPVNDAREVAATLRRLGFAEVREKQDLGRSALLDALRSFGELAAKSDWAIVYYSGHGIEVNGTNYLVPVDAKLESEPAVEDEAVSLKRLLDLTADARTVKVLILDACRSNAFPSRWSRTGATKGGQSKGFVPIKADGGTLIAYAAEPGSTAADGEGAVNPYAEALIRHMGEPIDIRRMFGLVYDNLVAQPKLRQTPWFHAALSGKELILKPQ